MSGDDSDQDDISDEESLEQQRQIRDHALNKNIQQRIEKIRECQIRYEETHDPKEALRALTFLSELNERLIPWAAESLILEIIKEYQVDPDLAQSIISLQIDNLQETAKWPADALRGLLATLAKTTNLGLPAPLAHSICLDLELANRGVKPKWFLVKGEKQTRPARRTLIVHQNRERKKQHQIWFVGWVYFHGHLGRSGNGIPTIDAEWNALATKLGANEETIRQWTAPLSANQNISLDKYFGEGAVDKTIDWAKFCKTRHLDYYPFPDEPEGWFQFSDEVFEQRIEEYLALDHIEPK